ncbi:MAG TPA: trypsin-like peptidase domain-containing protein [Ktedonobacterales bacterium]
MPANGGTSYPAQLAPYAPQPYAPPVTPPPSGPRRPSYVWLYPVGAVAVVILLIAAFAIGHGLGTTSTPTTNATGTNRPAATVAVPPAAQDLQQTIVNVIHTVQPSVVEVDGSSTTGGDIGSGEILTSDGYIVTNDHVVVAADTFTVVLSTGQRYPATVVGQDAQDDLAVLKINATGLQPIAIADSSKVQVGQFAIAIGSPLGLTQSATFGIVSAVNRSASEAPSGPAGQLTGLIQTSAPINPGNSGGALVDLQGRFIGIPTLGAVDPNTGSAADGIGFAIPSDRVKFVTDQLIKNGKLVTSGQGFLGIAGQDVTPQLASAYNLPVQSGVLVTGFANDAAGSSPAQSVGIHTGDIIVAVSGHTVSDNSDLASALTTQSPGTKVSVTVQRGSSQQTFSVTLGERPANSQG